MPPLLFVALGALNLLLSSAYTAPSPPPLPPPVLPYWHNWADTQGVSHWAKCALTNWTYEQLLPPGQPFWVENVESPSNLLLMTTPAGWTGPWHKNPEPQLVFVVAGAFLMTASDGTNVTLTVGDVFFGNDQLSTMGHATYNVGTVPGVLAAVQFASIDVSKYVGVPCWLH